MRILVQALVAAPGGSLTVLRDLVAAWPAADDLLIVCWRPEAAETLRATGHRVRAIDATSTERALLELRFRAPGDLDRYQYDVVWSQAVLLGGLGAPQAVHFRDIGSFVDIHPATTRQRLKSVRERWDLRRADLRIYNSVTMRDAVHRRYRAANRGRHVVIHNGLDLGPFDLAGAPGPSRTARTSDRTCSRILLPQSDAPHKRNWLAADVLALLRDRGRLRQPVHMTIVGRGEYRDLHERLSHHGLAGSATFAGYVSREAMAALYASHDAVLLTGRAESFGNPIVEAHAAVRPVVTPPFAVAMELGGPLSRVADADDAMSLAHELERVLSTTISPDHAQAALQFATRFAADAAARSLADALRSMLPVGGGRSVRQ